MARSGTIDLHSHTTESDGSFAPQELVELAVRNGLEALAITDHDTFTGFEKAVPYAKAAGLRLVQGIELNSRLELHDSNDYRSAHILGYFPVHEPAARFHSWLKGQQEERRERNRRLASALQEQGIDITLPEVEARGKTLAGRTHFAQILVEKGYVKNFEEAFTEYLGRGANTYIERESQSAEEAIGIIRESGGVPSLAHPVRLSLARDVERREIVRLKDAGLVGLEVIHSDQLLELQDYYRGLADELDLVPTGGSDFHGAVKPNIELGRGSNHNVNVPYATLEGIEQAAMRRMVSAN